MWDASLSGELHTGVARDETTCLHLALKGSEKMRHNMGTRVNWEMLTTGKLYEQMYELFSCC